MKINYREKVPCFGNEPAADMELMRKMRIAMKIEQMKRERRNGVILHFSAYTAGAVMIGLIFRKIQHLFTH